MKRLLGKYTPTELQRHPAAWRYVYNICPEIHKETRIHLGVFSLGVQNFNPWPPEGKVKELIFYFDFDETVGHNISGQPWPPSPTFPISR
jgi:hypothetical protein